MKLRIDNTLTKFLASVLMVSALMASAQAQCGTVTVKGKGIVDMTATADDTVFGAFDNGDLFANNHFEIKGKVNADGSASGNATFVFGDEFSVIWGAEVITLKCEIDTGTVAEDGTVVLQGLSFEEDFVENIVTFEELSPFEIIIDPSGSSTLRWCKTPALALEISKGHLQVK